MFRVCSTTRPRADAQHTAPATTHGANTSADAAAMASIKSGAPWPHQKSRVAWSAEGGISTSSGRNRMPGIRTRSSPVVSGTSCTSAYTPATSPIAAATMPSTATLPTSRPRDHMKGSAPMRSLSGLESRSGSSAMSSPAPHCTRLDATVRRACCAATTPAPEKAAKTATLLANSCAVTAGTAWTSTGFVRDRVCESLGVDEALAVSPPSDAEALCCVALRETLSGAVADADEDATTRDWLSDTLSLRLPLAVCDALAVSARDADSDERVTRNEPVVDALPLSTGDLVREAADAAAVADSVARVVECDSEICVAAEIVAVALRDTERVLVVWLTRK